MYLWLFSTGEAKGVLKAAFVMGPSLPERSARNVLIKASAYDIVQDVVRTEATQEV